MSHPVLSRRALGLAATVLTLAGLTGLSACGGDSGTGTPSAANPVPLRLGYFPNLTHATAVVGVDKGIFAQQLGNTVKFETKTFNAGPEAIEALLSGAIDATYIGPNPAINAYAQSGGQAVRIVAGSASGGVAFIVKPEIKSVDDLRGKTVSTPQLGNTQDVALRYWLKGKGLTTTKEGGGDVKIKPQANADIVTAFQSGAIQGAWVPEPYVSRLTALGGVKLIDERDLWPGGQFVITHLLVSKKFLGAHRDVVKNLVAGSVASNAWIKANPQEAQTTINEALGKITGKPLDAKLTAAAWPTLTFTDDPLSASLRVGAQHAEEIGLTKPVDLKDIYDLTLLNEVLKAAGQSEVNA
jgi:NitT/TauT family transport system substrate-binding protein